MIDIKHRNVYDQYAQFLNGCLEKSNFQNLTHNPSSAGKLRVFLGRLIKFLAEAGKLAEQFTGGYSNNFYSAEEFYTALAVSINKLKGGDTNQLNHLWLWFAPTCDWDDLIHQDGEDLANDIHALVTVLRKSLKVQVGNWN